MLPQHSTAYHCKKIKSAELIINSFLYFHYSPIIFTLTAAIISLEIQITNQGYRLNAFQGGTNESLTEMIGQLYSLDRLKEMLTNAAVDIFPDEDAFCYTEGSCEKNYVMEMHLYACMAALGLTHNFSWSRWNLLSGSRAAVLLMRELQEGKKAVSRMSFAVQIKAIDFVLK